VSLIFDRFPTYGDAGAFVDYVRLAHPELACSIYSSTGEADAHDPIPVELVAPIVHVERPVDPFEEPELEYVVDRFAGRFVGT
jgi:hypothetical protein